MGRIPFWTIPKSHAKLLASTAKAWAAHPLAMPARDAKQERLYATEKNNSYNILQLYFIHQMQSQIETKNQSYD